MASYEKRPAGWSVRWRMFDEAGNERRLRLSGFATKREAREAYEEYVASHKTCDGRPTSSHALSAVFASYQEYLRPNVKESTFYEISGRLTRLVLPVFGERDLETITPLELVHWQGDLFSRFSRPYVLAIRSAFTALWNYAMTFLGVRSNPWPTVRIPKDSSVPQEMSIWSPEEFGQFLSVVDLPAYRAFFRVLFLAGLRKGEALALSPADVQGSFLCITKTLTRKCLDGPFAITSPKTRGSVRRIGIPADLAEELRGLPGPFLFGGDVPFSDRTVERFFKAWTEEAGLRPIRLHDLRHSHASYLISSGCSVVAVSKRLGHSSVKQTLDTYSHALASDEEEIQKTLAGLGPEMGPQSRVLVLKKA